MIGMASRGAARKALALFLSVALAAQVMGVGATTALAEELELVGQAEVADSEVTQPETAEPAQDAPEQEMPEQEAPAERRVSVDPTDGKVGVELHREDKDKTSSGIFFDDEAGTSSELTEPFSSFADARVENDNYDYELGDGWYVLDGEAIRCEGVSVRGDAKLILGSDLLMTGRFVWVEPGASLTIYAKADADGRIAVAEGYTGGGGIINNGTLELHSGVLEGGADSVVGNSGTFIMLGGTVRNGNAMGVYNDEGATFDLCGGTISGNKSAGVYNRGTMKVSGAPVVDKNLEHNVMLYDSRVNKGTRLRVGVMEQGAHIGLTMNGEGSCGYVSEGYQDSNQGVDPSTFFFCDEGDKVLTANHCMKDDELFIDGKDGSITFIDGPGNYRTIANSMYADLAKLPDGHITLSDGYYYVSDNKTFGERMDIAGDVTLIINEDITFTVLGGIHVPSYAFLTVVATGEHGGRLVADAKNKSGCAGIGGNKGESGGYMDLACNIEATGGSDAAGIGGGEDGNSGRINILRGDVTATGNKGGAGIGGGENGDGGVIITAGHVRAEGGTYLSPVWTKTGGAGIGGGEDGNSTEIKIYGGRVEATGGWNAAGIGGGDTGDLVGDVLIRDAEVTADTTICDSASGAGIGGGYAGDQKGTVTIENSSVVAEPRGAGAGIGGGSGNSGHRGGHGGKVVIRNSYVRATSWFDGAGIGGGGGAAGAFDGGNGGTVCIEGGSTVDAICHGNSDYGYGAAIGAGQDGDEMGTVSFYKDAKVVSNDDGGVAVPVAEREAYCHYRHDVHVAPCEHDIYYTHTVNGHTKHCRHCAEFDGAKEEAHDFGETGAKSACTDCGYKRPQFAWNATTELGKNLHVTFWLDIPEKEHIDDYAGSYVEMSIGGKRARKQRVDFDKNGRTNAQGQYAFTMDVTAIEMGMLVTAEFHYGKDQVVTRADALEGCVHDWAYFHEVDKKTHNYARAMLNFGYYASAYLCTANKWVADKDYRQSNCFFKDDQADARSTVEQDLAAHVAKVDRGDSTIKSVNCSATFGSLASFDIMLKPSKLDEQGALEATFMGKPCTVETLEDGSVHVHVEGIRAADFDKPVCVSGSYGGKFSAEISVLSYAQAKLAAEKSNAVAFDALAALNQYYKCAAAFEQA